jgi:DNA mismatch repair endonuclease MutH
MILKYDDSSEKSIVSHSQKLVGKTIEDIISSSEKKVDINIKNKGMIGQFIEEYWFGQKPNSSPLPDFEKVGIELKVIPLIQQIKKIAVKERTKVCSIDYTKLIDESWNTSHAKLKLNKILFIYYLYEPKNILQSKVMKIDLWELNHGTNEIIIKQDWLGVQKSIVDGYAHLLSETQSKVLAASRSGSGGKNKDGELKDLVIQPNQTYEEKALKRAFSLKSSFTNQRWIEISTRTKYESIIETLNIINLDSFEKEVLKKINSLQGKSVLELSELFDVKIGQSKSRVASVMKKIIGFKSVRSKIKEFEQLGIEIKMINVREKDHRPLEAISFPAMKLQEFIIEEWEESTFLPMISKILFIPIYKKHKDIKDLGELYLGKVFFWTPTNDELDTIKHEWLNYQTEVKERKCKVTKIPNKSKRGYREVSGLSKESMTKIIHMRPHGRDSDDRDEDGLGNSIVKQSFWLNTKFVQQLIMRNL